MSENIPAVVSDCPSVGLDCAHLLPQDVRIDKQLQSGLRVTVQLSQTHSPGTFAFILHFMNSSHQCVCPSPAESKHCKGVVVAPHVPRTGGGLYWGYSVRLASCLSTTKTRTLLMIIHIV